MKFLVWILGLFVAAVVVTLTPHNSSYVLVVYPPYRIELSLTLFIALALLVFICGYLLVRTVDNILGLPDFVKAFRHKRAQEKSRALQKEMLGAFFEGRYEAAEKAAEKAMKSGGHSTFYSIIAARSAHELREFEKRDAYLSAAEDLTTDDSAIRLMTASKFMLDQHDPHAALKVLKELRDTGVKGHPGAMSLELKAQQQTGNWDEVLKLLDQMEKRKLIDETVVAQLRQQAWLEKIGQQKDLESLNACLKKIPGDLRRRGKIVSAASRALIRYGGCVPAEKLLSDSLNAQWDSELVMLYGDCLSEDTLVQIQQAEKWLNLHKQDAGLLLTLGKLCLHQKLWGKAQSYLDASISLKPSYAAYTVLGQLAERLGRLDDASGYYQSALKFKQNPQ